MIRVLVFLAFASTAQAGSAWDMFVARCLDPFENHALAIHAGLQAQPRDQMHAALTVFGPSDEGYLLLLDAAPSEGERACAVLNPSVQGPEAAFLDWAEAAVQDGRYRAEGETALLSVEWIEPRLRFDVAYSAQGTLYEILETDLES